MTVLFPKVVLALRQAGVVKVVARYRARSGHVDWDFKPLDSNENLIAAASIANAIGIEAVCLIFFDQTVSARYPSWNLGPGSFGSFEWDIAQDRVTHAHNARVIAIRRHSRTGI
jgi:hypothetical protein